MIGKYVKAAVAAADLGALTLGSAAEAQTDIDLPGRHVIRNSIHLEESTHWGQTRQNANGAET